MTEPVPTSPYPLRRFRSPPCSPRWMGQLDATIVGVAAPARATPPTAVIDPVLANESAL